MRLKRFLVLGAWIAVAAVPPVFAAEGTAGDYFAGMGKNLGRGLWNVVSSPAEIPCTMSDDMEGGNAAAGFFTGMGKGLVFMGRRIVVGASEILTFVLPAAPVLPGVCREA